MDVEKKRGKAASLKKKKEKDTTLAPSGQKRNVVEHTGGDEAELRTDNIHSNLDAQVRVPFALHAARLSRSQ